MAEAVAKKPTRGRKKAVEPTESKAKSKKVKGDDDADPDSLDNDDSADYIYDTTSTAHSPAPLKPRGRMTKAKEIAMIKAERKRVVQAKLASLQDMSQSEDVPEDRPRLVKFADNLEESEPELEVIEEPKIAPKKKRAPAKKK